MKYIFLILLVFTVFFFFTTQEEKIITIGEEAITVAIADTHKKRVIGLSGKEEQSMLFIFPQLDYYGIWMKDMLFSLDIIWIDESFMVVHVERNISPDTYPEIFTPERKALYVLEVPTGSLTVVIGDIVAI